MMSTLFKAIYKHDPGPGVIALSFLLATMVSLGILLVYNSNNHISDRTARRKPFAVLRKWVGCVALFPLYMTAKLLVTLGIFDDYDVIITGIRRLAAKKMDLYQTERQQDIRETTVPQKILETFHYASLALGLAFFMSSTMLRVTSPISSCISLAVVSFGLTIVALALKHCETHGATPTQLFQLFIDHISEDSDLVIALVSIIQTALLIVVSNRLRLLRNEFRDELRHDNTLQFIRSPHQRNAGRISRRALNDIVALNQVPVVSSQGSDRNPPELDFEYGLRRKTAVAAYYEQGLQEGFQDGVTHVARLQEGLRKEHLNSSIKSLHKDASTMESRDDAKAAVDSDEKDGEEAPEISRDEIRAKQEHSNSENGWEEVQADG